MRPARPAPRPPEQRPKDDGDITRAWIAVAFIPVFFFLAIAAGEAVISALGYPVGADYPGWVALLSDLAALAVALAPCVTAVFSGLRARRARARNAAGPLLCGAVAGAAFAVLTVVSEVGNLV